MKSVQIRSFFWSVFPVFGLNAVIYSVNLRIKSEYMKLRTRRNSVFGHFSHSDSCIKKEAYKKNRLDITRKHEKGKHKCSTKKWGVHQWTLRPSFHQLNALWYLRAWKFALNKVFENESRQSTCKNTKHKTTLKNQISFKCDFCMCLLCSNFFNVKLWRSSNLLHCEKQNLLTIWTTQRY